VKGGPQTWDEDEPVVVKGACISLDGTRIAAIFDDGLFVSIQQQERRLFPH
jgi:hypothetical protein